MDNKNKSEGDLKKVKICLGWIVDTRRLLMSLPEHKYIAWSKEAEGTLKAKQISGSALCSLLGRLEIITIIIVSMGHFLNNI